MLNAFFSDTGKLFVNIQGRYEEGKRDTIPQAPNQCGGAGWLRRAPKSRDNVTSTFFNSTFASERLQVRTWGRQTCFLPWAPSNLVTPLLTYKCCNSFSHAAIWFNQGH